MRARIREGRKDGRIAGLQSPSFAAVPRPRAWRRRRTPRASCGSRHGVAQQHLNRSRYYDPGYGRFSQADPAHATVALYDYATNNPTNFVDPMGLYCANPSQQLFGFGVNRIKPTIDAMDWNHPGICYYMGPTAENVYIDPYESPYDLAGMGMGTLWAYHINAKLLQWGMFRGGGGYNNASPLSNLHIGFWNNSNNICFIVDDSRPGFRVGRRRCTSRSACHIRWRCSLGSRFF